MAVLTLVRINGSSISAKEVINWADLIGELLKWLEFSKSSSFLLIWGKKRAGFEFLIIFDCFSYFIA